jgi:hypothetical protein
VPGAGDGVLEGGLEGAGLSDDEDDGGALPLLVLQCMSCVRRLPCCPRHAVSAASPVCLPNMGTWAWHGTDMHMACAPQALRRAGGRPADLGRVGVEGPSLLGTPRHRRTARTTSVRRWGCAGMRCSRWGTAGPHQHRAMPGVKSPMTVTWWPQHLAPLVSRSACPSGGQNRCRGRWAPPAACLSSEAAGGLAENPNPVQVDKVRRVRAPRVLAHAQHWRRRQNE